MDECILVNECTARVSHWTKITQQFGENPGLDLIVSLPSAILDEVSWAWALWARVSVFYCWEGGREEPGSALVGGGLPLVL